MCGIVAVIPKGINGLYPSDLKVFHQLLWADQLRGTDGCGIFYADNKKEVGIHKTPQSVNFLLAQKSYTSKEVHILKNAWFLVGHNRAATKGTNTQANTHPFTEGHITLIHNGTINGDHSYLGKQEVDSHAICDHISKNGYEKTLGTINGAFALVWYDQKLDTLFFTRNYQRPLYLVETSTNYILSSELELADWICTRNNEKIHTTELIKTGTVYSINSKDLTINKREVKLFTPPAMPYNPTYQQQPGVQPKTQSNNHQGEKITFCPYNWEASGKDRYKILCYPEDPNSDFDSVLIYGNKTDMDKFYAMPTLTGIVCSVISYPNSKLKDAIVRDVEEVVDTTIMPKLTVNELANLQADCDMCGGVINKKLDFAVDRDLRGKITHTYCHICKPIMEGFHYGV